ncbi:MAG: 23S rRNA (adenine(2503)-C(2))-methyltransferase RlmN [Candidatus Omnitrophica bacterium]|nr:23S rRNA (adenine(2503)-C(2))-methyltransferase RlmN [Candidatus Omnitrophota bacterium]
MINKYSEEKFDIRNFSYEELAAYLKAEGERPFRATQIFEWLYQKGAWSFDEMNNLSKPLRVLLTERFILKPRKIAEKQISADGTTKFLFELDDQQRIETVLIPTAKRTTVCVSTQAGCKFGCRFCASGIGGWKRNLTTAEIITQILHIKEESKKHGNPLSHIVYMGVGEPLDNFAHVMKSVRIINDKKGVNIGARRITVSTCGVIPGIEQLAKEGIQIELAISLHGFDNASRNVLMPVNRKYPFDDLMAACRAYIKATKRQITFEYILIKDVTCTEKAAAALKKSFKGIICKMNLIPYNPVSEFDCQTPSRNEMFAFKNQLERIGIHTTLRAPRGKDVAAACGQLRYTVDNVVRKMT